MPVNKIIKNTDVVSCDYIVYLRDFALSKGIAAKTLVENSEGDLALLINPPKQVSERIFHQFGFNMFNAFDNPYVGVIEFGRGMLLSSHGSLGMAIQGAYTLNEVAQLAQQYYSIRANARSLHLYEQASYSCMRLTHEDSEYDTYFSMAALISFERAVINLLNNHELSGECIIHLKESEPANFPWQMVKGYSLKFSMPNNQLLIPNFWMCLPINPTDPELANLAKDQCDQALEEIRPQDLVEDIRQKLKTINNKNVSLKEMAAILNVSASTLQRRLREFDTTYKDIKLQERLIEAKQLLLSETYTLERISECLGFSDASSFTKSFKTFCGCTPAAYRKEHQLH